MKPSELGGDDTQFTNGVQPLAKGHTPTADEALRLLYAQAEEEMA